jgi:hypothetical protein
MAHGEQRRRGAAGREGENGRSVDPERVEKGDVGIRLRGDRRILGKRRAEVSEARRRDDPIPLRHERPPRGWAVATANDAVDEKERYTLAPLAVLERAPTSS